MSDLFNWSFSQTEAGKFMCTHSPQISAGRLLRYLNACISISLYKGNNFFSLLFAKCFHRKGICRKKVNFVTKEPTFSFWYRPYWQKKGKKMFFTKLPTGICINLTYFVFAAAEYWWWIPAVSKETWPWQSPGYFTNYNVLYTVSASYSRQDCA